MASDITTKDYDMYTIVNNVPVPDRKKQSSRESKYPFAKMQPGDSFYAPVTPNGLLALAYTFRKRNDPSMLFRARPEGDGARIWRVK